MIEPVAVDSLYINGDSWAYGSELRDPTALDITNDFDPVHDAWRRAHNWTGHLARSYDLELVDSSWAGGSNDRILRTTISDVTRLLQQGKKPFVVIAWTQLQRFELFADGHWKEFVGPSDASTPSIGFEIWEKYSSDYSDLMRYLQQVILLDAFLKVNNVPYFGTNVFRHNYAILEDHARNPAFKPYLYQLGKTVKLERHMYNYAISQILTAHLDVDYGAGGHPLERGHTIIADYLKAQLDQRFTITKA
jgi:hypothetical protein